MARRVVQGGTDRCDGCRLPPRWCVCGALPDVTTALAVGAASAYRLLKATDEARAYLANRRVDAE